jgi:hypothetical protein
VSGLTHTYLYSTLIHDWCFDPACFIGVDGWGVWSVFVWCSWFWGFRLAFYNSFYTCRVLHILIYILEVLVWDRVYLVGKVSVRIWAFDVRCLYLTHIRIHIHILYIILLLYTYILISYTLLLFSSSFFLSNPSFPSPLIRYLPNHSLILLPSFLPHLLPTPNHHPIQYSVFSISIGVRELTWIVLRYSTVFHPRLVFVVILVGVYVEMKESCLSWWKVVGLERLMFWMLFEIG